MASNETDADHQSRLNISLETGSTPYDEVIAFTERILNKNFETMFEMHKADMKDIMFNDEDVGLVNIEIDSPRLIIPGSKDQAYGKDVYYMLRFKSGYVETATGIQRKMDGWELAIPTVLNTEEVKPDKTIYKEIQIDETTHKAVSVAGTIYKFPGDYSVERLFAQLTTAQWSTPHPDLSLITDEKGKPMSITQYCNSPGGSKIWVLLSIVLGQWGNEQHIAGRSTLNVTFNLPEKRVNIQQPTYAPTDLYQQTYPYKCPQKGITEPKTSRTGEGFNALLWCEMVAGNVPPTTKQLEWRGNYVIPRRSYKGGDAIEGTFALSYKHFLEGHLLKRLQRLNQASQVANLWVSRSYDNEKQMFMTSWNYEVGNYNLNHTSEAFKFKRVETNKDYDDSVVTYEWDYNDKISDKDRNHAWAGHGGACSTTDHYTTTKVVLSWKIGSSVFDVTGHTDYVYDNTIFPNNNRVLDEKTGRLRYFYEMDWKIEVAITGIKDGRMSLDVRTPPGAQPQEVANLRVRQKPNELIEDRMWCPDGQEQEIRDQWLKRMRNCMTDIERDIEQEFESTAKFVYPGNGDLNFSNPVISRFGNVLAVVEHKPLDGKALTDGKYITVHPALKIPRVSQSKYEPIANTPSQGTPKPVVKLTWTIDPCEAVSEKKGPKFVLMGKNNTNDPVGLQYIWIRFTSGVGGPQLFKQEVINQVKSPYYVEPVKAVPKVPKEKSRLGKMWDNLPGSADDEGKMTDTSQPGDGKTEGAIKTLMTGSPAPPRSPRSDSVTPTDSGAEHIEGSGTITMTSSSPSSMNLMPIEVRFQSEAEGKHWWRLTIKPQKKGTGFAVQPGESIIVEMIDMDMGLADRYPIIIRENWLMLPELKKMTSPPNSDDFVINFQISPF
ncbi:uncharacterized protein FPRO_02058 [Fusarium proliferatum ET1]|uniref:Uncharacterized protein n=1 Tax=Fusarium proliferatum (strain ET1) TaxID=1227346 RepID=A0A1L7UZE8_FUSPR|nr:uncharacterized protein FPRO_02058 [Fusarium proliferatum ET1]CZR32172.1 uncharacterized protein FPRO_02058 [Fusarium proliferatum ET1]